jgi:hypothetical protein
MIKYNVTLSLGAPNTGETVEVQIEDRGDAVQNNMAAIAAAKTKMGGDGNRAERVVRVG